MACGLGKIWMRVDRSIVQGDAGGRGLGPDRTRTWVIMAFLFMTGFLAALVAGFEADRRTAADLDRTSEAIAARATAQNMDGFLGGLAGRLAAAARVGQTDAAAGRGFSSVTLFGADRAIVGSTHPDADALAAIALEAAGNEPVWQGVIALEGGAKLGMVRRVEGLAAVGMVDPIAMLAAADVNGRAFVIASTTGRIVTASPDIDLAGRETVDQLFGKRPIVEGGVVNAYAGVGSGEKALVVGFAPLVTDGLEVFVASPSKNVLERLQDLLGLYLLLGAAPVFALASFIVVLRHHQRRAKAAESQLQATVARFELAVDGAQCGVWEYTHDNDTLEMTELAQKILRWEGARARLSDLIRNLAQHDQAPLRDAISRARLSGGITETVRLGPSSSVRYIELRGFAIQDSAKSEGSRLVGTVVDVTEKRMSEFRAQALERRLREAIDGFTGPFALWDKGGRIVLWNRSFASLFQLSPQTLKVGATYGDVWAAAAQAIKQQGPIDADPRRQREVALKGGEWLQIEERRTVDGGLVTVGAEITALKQSEMTLNASREKLRLQIEKHVRLEGQTKQISESYRTAKQRAEEANKAKDTFLQNMSHELRTPLNAIIGFSEIMRDEMFGPIGTESYIAYARDIHESGSLLLNLITDILDMSKIEAGKMPVQKRETDAFEVLESAIRVVRHNAAQNGVTIEIKVDEKLPEIEADPMRLKQMLLNLLTNAYKFSPSGSVVTVELAEEGPNLRISVIDRGIGIPAEHLGRIGKPFEQVEDNHARKQPGTGLGLAITRALAEMHGGRLELQSVENEGTTVTIYLPIEDVADPLPAHPYSLPEPDITDFEETENVLGSFDDIDELDQMDAERINASASQTYAAE
jgi:two-component system, cell cycle sensor histidine kinase PleC